MRVPPRIPLPSPALIAAALVVVAACGHGSGGDGTGASFTTVVGGFGYGDGGAPTATFVAPAAVTSDGDGNAFVLDYNPVADGGRVRRIDARSGTITTVAGGCERLPEGKQPTDACHLHDLHTIVATRAGDLFAARNVDGRVFRIDGRNGTLRHIAGAAGAGPCFEHDRSDALETCLGGTTALALDADENLFLAQQDLGIVRRLDTRSGRLTVVSGKGFGGHCEPGPRGPDGLRAVDACLEPRGIAVDPNGNLVIASGRRVHRVERETGIITPIAGTGGPCHGEFGDGGPAATACFGVPTDVTAASNGDLFVADVSRLRRIDAATEMITTVAVIDRIVDLAAAPARRVLVASPLQVDRLDVASGALARVAGNGTASICGEGDPAGPGCAGQPAGVAADAAGNVYFSDLENFRVARVDAASGALTTVAGGRRGFCGDGGPAIDACLRTPTDLVVDAGGNVFLADRGDDDRDGPPSEIVGRIRRIDAATGTITTVAGNCVGIETDRAIDACFAHPQALVLDGADGLLVGDDFGVWRIDLAAGSIARIAGNPFLDPGCEGEGIAALGACMIVTDLARDDAGTLYLIDAGRTSIRRVDAATGLITTVAGNGAYGSCFEDDVPATATCLIPTAIALDASGRLVIASAGVLRAVDPVTGLIRTVAGDPAIGDRCFQGDFNRCLIASDLERDPEGRLLFSDAFGRRVGRVTLP